MADERLWQAFCKTGRIADYLRYCGVDIYSAAQAKKEADGYVGQDRGTDPERKQQHR